MKRALVLGCFAMFVAQSQSAVSKEISIRTIEDIYLICRNFAEGHRVEEAVEAFAQGVCVGAIDGIKFVMGSNCDSRLIGKTTENNFAARTSGISTRAAVQAFLNWAEAHPREWPFEPYFGIVWAMRETFPCE